jgi:hypothetical protein
MDRVADWNSLAEAITVNNILEVVDNVKGIKEDAFQRGIYMHSQIVALD